MCKIVVSGRRYKSIKKIKIDAGDLHGGEQRENWIQLGRIAQLGIRRDSKGVHQCAHHQSHVLGSNSWSETYAGRIKGNSPEIKSACLLDGSERKRQSTSTWRSSSGGRPESLPAPRWNHHLENDKIHEWLWGNLQRLRYPSILNSPSVSLQHAWKNQGICVSDRKPRRQFRHLARRQDKLGRPYSSNNSKIVRQEHWCRDKCRQICKGGQISEHRPSFGLGPDRTEECWSNADWGLLGRFGHSTIWPRLSLLCNVVVVSRCCLRTCRRRLSSLDWSAQPIRWRTLDEDVNNFDRKCRWKWCVFPVPSRIDTDHPHVRMLELFLDGLSDYHSKLIKIQKKQYIYVYLNKEWSELIQITGVTSNVEDSIVD